MAANLADQDANEYGDESGLWIAIGGGSLSDSIEYSIDTRREFSHSVVYADSKPRRAELVIVSLRGSTPDYLAISQCGRRTTTGQTSVNIAKLIRIKQLSSDEIERRLPKKFANRFSPPSAGIYRPSPKLWKAILEILIGDTSEDKRELASLQQIVIDANRIELGTRANSLEVFERDAVASALQAWAGAATRRSVLKNANSALDDRAPFLTRLTNVQSREDPQINHDHTVFPGMTIAARDIISTVRFTDGQEQLTILNCNRQPLEETLGVDLIYYSHRFKAFTLVQYKRMTGEEGTAGYRPNSDRNHEKELARMKSAERLLQTLPPTGASELSSFRLSSDPFFIKLCEAKASVALDSGMVTGMYVPLRLWENLLKSPAVIGPKGGVEITWQNCLRRFCNTEFTGLLRNGWIGSAESHTEKLSEIVTEVLGSARMLVLAATQQGEPSQDYRRDHFGRFCGRGRLRRGSLNK